MHFGGLPSFFNSQVIFTPRIAESGYEWSPFRSIFWGKGLYLQTFMWLIDYLNFSQAYCLVLFICAACLFGTIVSQVLVGWFSLANCAVYYPMLHRRTSCSRSMDKFVPLITTKSCDRSMRSSCNKQQNRRNSTRYWRPIWPFGRGTHIAMNFSISVF